MLAEEREIDLIDFFSEMVKHWRGAIVCMLVGFLCFGAFGYISGDVSDDNDTAVDRVLFQDDAYIEAKKYENESLIMRFNYEAVPSVSLTFVILSEDDIQYELVQAYEASFSTYALASEISSELGVENDLGEYIIFNTPDGTLDKSSRYFTISCAYPDGEKCKEMGEVIEAYMVNKSLSMQESVGSHILQVVNVDFGYTKDWNYQAQQQDIRKKTLEQKDLLINMVKSLDGAQRTDFIMRSHSDLWQESRKELAKGMTLDNLDDITSSSQLASTKKRCLKMAVMGAFGLCFLYILIWAVRYIFDGYIKASDDMMSLVKVPQLGFVSMVDEPAFLVDKWVYRLKHHGKKTVTVDKTYEIIASCVAVNAKKKGVEELTIIGTGTEGENSECFSKLIELLGDKYKLTVNVVDDIVYNQESIAAMSEAKSAVLVETVGKSLYTDLYKEMQLLNQLEIPVLGGVIVE